MSNPKLVTVCGSSRFIDIVAVSAWFLERDEGAITMSMHLLPGWYPEIASDHMAEQEGVADKLDALHLKKIDMSDEIFVVDFDNYVGSSTSNEVAHATSNGTPIRYFSSDPLGAKIRQMLPTVSKGPSTDGEVK